MEKHLNQQAITAAMEAKGLNPAGLAKALDLSRESVSKWLNDKSFPTPDKLLRLGKLLDLPFATLVIRSEANTPVVAFRKKGVSKTQDHHIEKAQTMGRMLRHLVPYLPFDKFIAAPVLKQPSLDYGYIQEVAAKVRHELNVGPEDAIDFRHLIRRFRDLQTVLVPVLWGNKKRHENAIHIYLPDSQTTWVYLNLDVHIHDFKFWMAHELGHCLSPSLIGDDAEDFADAFAAALLFPQHVAVSHYDGLIALGDVQKQLKKIIRIAEDLLISPFTVVYEINKYAKLHQLKTLNLDKQLGAYTTTLNKSYLNVSQTIFGNDTHPATADYIRATEDLFESAFFTALREYLRESQHGPGIIQTLMDIPLLDARSLHTELT